MRLTFTSEKSSLMKKSVRRVLVALLAVLIVMQFIQPDKTNPESPAEADFLAVHNVDGEVGGLIKRACYDCHSNQTVYPWYSRISPLSWYLNKHIEEGKEGLNFSEYGQLEKADKIGALADFYDVLDAGTMPLQSYMLLHKQARLSLEDSEALRSWSEKEALKVMRE